MYIINPCHRCHKCHKSYIKNTVIVVITVIGLKDNFIISYINESYCHLSYVSFFSDGYDTCDSKFFSDGSDKDDNDLLF